MEKIKLNYAHLCDYAFSSENNKLNIIGTFKDIRSSVFPCVHPQMFLAVGITFSDLGEYTNKFRLANTENDKEVFSIEVVFKSDKETSDFVFVGQLNNLRFDTEGKYELKVFTNDTLVTSLPLTLSKAG